MPPTSPDREKSLRELRETTHRVFSGEFSGITQDSREVRPGYIFAALSGTRVDGSDFIPQALKNGATCIIAKTGTKLPEEYKKSPPWNPSPEVRKRLGIELFERPPQKKLGISVSTYRRDSEKPQSKSDMGIMLIEDDNPHLGLSQICAAYYNKQPQTVVAVTGTNGKTSTAHFAAQLWKALGKKAASMGTLGLVVDGKTRGASSMTTPDPVTLHRNLADLAQEGVEALCLEASSHGLEQYRLDGVRFAAAGYTNISRDHLDYHGDMDSYFASKLRLFSEVLPKGSTAVINADVPEAARLIEACEKAGHNILSYGRKGKDLEILDLSPEEDGLALNLAITGSPVSVMLPLVGAFQASNVLCAFGLVWAAEGQTDEALIGLLRALPRLEEVPGRMQRIPGPKAVYVDYAHTPDALRTAIKALRPHTSGRLHCLFGCGGDRDPGKRPMMGEFAARLADRVIVTDDNPRSEDPAAIRSEILEGTKEYDKPIIEIEGRREAIQAAISQMEPGDVLLVAGKGHETGQTIGEVTHPFDDAQEVKNAMH
ncbi:MAG: UDP-N-acetylmuramoyl-L-alanyl-D-glutamate--2,6-diaminopimelate ligase [Alphaproteobacteria bacterium]|nr:UDP-N-acetylmuramoyl-L-alanyl-D-glutamate--2,6-diaminopimelate ligase [Alphaproteobacteria bacterium]MCB9974291.1 UDP-N-acetylmuramoyl-L-alanyl-D-glutamate--2,6-diaminopimelate ligase [Rhodospirillales bacterium]